MRGGLHAQPLLTSSIKLSLLIILFLCPYTNNMKHIDPDAGGIKDRMTSTASANAHNSVSNLDSHSTACEHITETFKNIHSWILLSLMKASSDPLPTRLVSKRNRKILGRLFGCKRYLLISLGLFSWMLIFNGGRQRSVHCSLQTCTSFGAGV